MKVLNFHSLKLRKKLNCHFLQNLRTKFPDKHHYTNIGLWRKFFVKTLYLGRCSQNNEIEYFNNGTDFIKKQWDAIKTAQKRVIFEMYTLEFDNIGKTTINHLVQAKQRGAEVIVLVDDFGSNSTGTKEFAELYQNGIKVNRFNKINFRTLLGEIASLKLNSLKFLYKRNHRKCIVVDDKVAFVGSSNHGEKYADLSVGGSGLFRDTGCRIEGPAVQHILPEFKSSLLETPECGETTSKSGRKMQLVKNFMKAKSALLWGKMQTYRWKSVKKKLRRARELYRLRVQFRRHIMAPGTLFSADGVLPKYFKNEQFLQILTSSNSKNSRNIASSLNAAIKCSSDYIYITNPYFIPPLRLMLALLQAAKRGVKIAILTTGPSDVKVAKFASHFFLRTLHERGVRVFELQNKVLHAKTIVVDGIYSSVGSFNLDEWSYRRNLELNVASISAKNAKQLESHFKEDLKNSTEWAKDDFKRTNPLTQILADICLFFAKVPRLVKSFCAGNKLQKPPKKQLSA